MRLGKSKLKLSYEMEKNIACGEIFKIKGTIPLPLKRFSKNLMKFGKRKF